MNSKQLEHYKNTFGDRYKHRMEFADYMVECILNIPIFEFSIKKIYAAYDKFQERLCESELPDGETITIEDDAEMTKEGEDVLIRIKTDQRWAEVRCPLELIKFTDWWLYT